MKVKFAFSVSIISYLHPVCLLNFSRLKDLKYRFWGIIWLKKSTTYAIFHPLLST